MSRENLTYGPRDRKRQDNSYEAQPDSMNGRDGADDALADSSPTDSRSDEKVIVNEQRSNKTVNAPSQTAANTSETDEETIN